MTAQPLTPTETELLGEADDLADRVASLRTTARILLNVAGDAAAVNVAIRAALRPGDPDDAHLRLAVLRDLDARGVELADQTLDDFILDALP
ncbi:hypothetical protein [Cellulomonas hominis]